MLKPRTYTKIWTGENKKKIYFDMLHFTQYFNRQQCVKQRRRTCLGATFRR